MKESWRRRASGAGRVWLCVAVIAAFVALPGCAGRSAPEDQSALSKLDFREVVRGAKAKVFPAVVFIRCIREDLEPGKKTNQEVAGSGVIISEKGEVLTNWHVIDKATSIRCLLQDGRAMDAKLLGSDEDVDLALLQLQKPDGTGPLPCAAIGDSTELTEGDFVMAMGAPWGLSRSVSIGIIACTHRFLAGAGEYSLWLQTDASICPGNSGGPLVNTRGEVIGVTTLGTFFGGDMGFAVPSETIAIIVKQIRESGKVNWSYTGLQLQPLRDFNRNMYFDETEGVIVSGTDADSPARMAGLQARDRILRVNDAVVTATTEEDLPAIRRMLGLLSKTEPAKLEVVRGVDKMTITLTPREKGRVEGEELECPRWDLTVKTINQFNNPDLFFYRREGVYILGIKYPGNAENSGLRQSDIIVQVEGKEIKTLDDIRAIHKQTVENVKNHPRILLTVMRAGMTRQVLVDIAREYGKD